DKKFEAHAWVECGGAAINDPEELHRHYAAFDGTLPVGLTETQSAASRELFLPTEHRQTRDCWKSLPMRSPFAARTHAASGAGLVWASVLRFCAQDPRLSVGSSPARSMAEHGCLPTRGSMAGRICGGDGELRAIEPAGGTR